MKLVEEETVVKTEQEMPVDFLTSFVSECWAKIGELKATSAALKDTFNGENVCKITDILQSVVDAYLIAAGQLENCLAEVSGIEVPEKADTAVIEVKPVAAVAVEPEKVPEDVVEPEKTVDPIAVIDGVEPEDAIAPTEDEIEVAAKSDTPKVNSLVGDEFEYFVDFEEPDLDQPKLTDDEIYGKK